MTAPENSRWRRLLGWAPLVGGLVFVVASPIAAAFSREATGTSLTFWVAVQAGATGLAWLIPAIETRRAEKREEAAEVREVDARVATRVAINDALDPIVRLLGRIAIEASKVERDKLRAQAVPLVLTTAAQLIGPDRTRACWFVLEAGPPKRLVPSDAVGRAGSPSSTFIEGTPAGDAALEMVLADEDCICEDIQTDPPPGWDATTTRDYRTFVSVSVIARDTAYGMLTLDALEPGELTIDDMKLLRLMAGTLAAALAPR